NSLANVIGAGVFYTSETDGGAASGSISENKVILAGSRVQNVYGTWSDRTTLVIGDGNSVEFREGTNHVANGVYGAFVNSSNTTKLPSLNNVTFSGGTNVVAPNVYGFFNNNGGNVGAGNFVALDGGTNDIDGSLYGVYNLGVGNVGAGSSARISGGTNTLENGIHGVYNAGAGTVGTGSNVTITGGTTRLVANGGSIYAAYNAGAGTVGGGNLVSVSGEGTILSVGVAAAPGTVAAAYTAGGDVGAGNRVVFENGTNVIVGKAVGVITESTSSTGVAGAASGENSVTFAGGTNTVENVYGSEILNAGSVAGASAVVFSGGTNTVNQNVEAARVGASATGTPGSGNRIDFLGGTNEVKNNVLVADGTLNLTGGTNTLGDDAAADSVRARNLAIGAEAGTNVFNAAVAVSGDFEINGGVNTFAGALTAGTSGTSLFRALGGENSFKGLVTVGGSAPLSFEGATATYEFDGGLTAANLSAINVNNPNGVVFKGDVTAPTAVLSVANGSKASFQNSTDLAANVSSLNVLTGGTLEIGTGKVDLGTGNLSLADQAVVKIEGSGGTHGEITGTALNSTGVIKLELNGTAADFANDVPIFDFASFSQTPVFESTWYALEIDAAAASVKVVSEKKYLDVMENLTGTGNASDNMKKVALLLDKIKGTDTPESQAFTENMTNILTALEANPADAEAGLRQLAGELLLNVPRASYQTALQVGGAVFGRLDTIRAVSTLTPPAAGSGEIEFNRVWIGGFGTLSRQKDKGGVPGYKYNNGGFALGFDHEFFDVPGLVAGISTAFSFGTLTVNGGWAKVDVDARGVGVYASYALETGTFLDGSFNYGYSDNKSTVDLVGGGTKTGDFGVKTFQFAVRGGRTITTESAMSITPIIGMRYTRFSQSGFTEGVDNRPGFPGMAYGKVKDSILEIPLEVRVSKELQAGTSVATPELMVGWSWFAKKPKGVLSAGFDGNGERTDLVSSRPLTNYFKVGLGVKVDTMSPLDLYANYDLNVSSNYASHRFSGGLGYQF
ncbi:MAG: autotransporter domain-containing protein, partial [Deltaproteobacteria bacterium]|nr:autotransporter domain-containing protein [Deltaproteobacteria bacterium]